MKTKPQINLGTFDVKDVHNIDHVIGVLVESLKQAESIGSYLAALPIEEVWDIIERLEDTLRD